MLLNSQWLQKYLPEVGMGDTGGELGPVGKGKVAAWGLKSIYKALQSSPQQKAYFGGIAQSGYS